MSHSCFLPSREADIKEDSSVYFTYDTPFGFHSIMITDDRKMYVLTETKQWSEFETVVIHLE